MRVNKLSSDQQELLGDIVGNSEIADMFKASRGLVSMWAKPERETGFPDPVLSLNAGRFYRRSEVAAWYEIYRVTIGRRDR